VHGYDRAAHDGLGRAGGHPLTDERVDDRVQALACGFVSEHEIAKPSTVDLPVAHVFLPELLDDEIEAQAAWRIHGVRRLVRVDDDRTELPKHVRNRRFARPNAAGQPDELQLAWMGDEEKFDAVVVGAGPAGSAAAITMAKAGLQVALLERGVKPGSKNVMGGILYNHYLEEIVGDDWKQAPLERPIIEERRWIMTPEAAIGIDYKNLRNRAHPHSFSVLRARFDAWFAEQAEKAGAMVVPETVVDRLIVKNGRVVGVGTGRGDDLYADVVIVCEGIGLGASLLEKTVIDGKPLRRRLRPNEVAMAVKEIMHLDPGLIEERFNCEPGEGCTIECFGDATMGMAGFMFIYTNKDTLSVGGGALLSEFNQTLRSPNEVMEHFKNHPAVKPLLRGAETVEYLAHLIPEGGFRGIPKVYGPGYLVCGDAAMLSNPVHREGSNLAMESGRLAGETVVHAKEAGDFSEPRLAEYRGKLDNSWVMADMKKYDGAVPLLEHNPQMLTKYPQVADRALDEFFRVDGTSKWKKQSNIVKMIRKEGAFRMGWDTMKALWTMK
jgi:electron transfer flavoprotein-quinone oxidoreductase